MKEYNHQEKNIRRKKKKHHGRKREDLSMLAGKMKYEHQKSRSEYQGRLE